MFAYIFGSMADNPRCGSSWDVVEQKLLQDFQVTAFNPHRVFRDATEQDILDGQVVVELDEWVAARADLAVGIYDPTSPGVNREIGVALQGGTEVFALWPNNQRAETKSIFANDTRIHFHDSWASLWTGVAEWFMSRGY